MNRRSINLYVVEEEKNDTRDGGERHISIYFSPIKFNSNEPLMFGMSLNVSFVIQRVSEEFTCKSLVYDVVCLFCVECSEL